MKLDAWHLPWGRETVSHGILDINRGCNITCRACYNSRPAAYKSLPEIEAELRELRSRRKLAYVSLVGGEVLLHPRLIELIGLLKAQRLCVQMFTNGLLLDDHRLDELARTGIDIIYVHIDGGQTRPDLPPDPTPDQLRRLWDEKANLIARHGIDVGLAMTAYADRRTQVRDMVEYVIESPHVHYLLVTLFRDTENINGLTGNIDSGIHGRFLNSAHPRQDTLTNWDMIEDMLSHFSMRPFAYLGSSRDHEDPRWLSYMVATGRAHTGTIRSHCLKASALEKLYCTLSLHLTGKYPMYQRQSTVALMIQLFLNSLMGGDGAGNWKFMSKALRPGARLNAKRLLFQCPAQLEEDGSLTHCQNCPDAVVKNDGLVPLCISDRFE